MKQQRRILLLGKIATLFLILSFTDAWISSGALSQTSPSAPVLRREKIAVMPFLKGRFGTDLSAVLNCPLCELSFDEESLTPGCDKTLTLFVQEALERRHEEMLVPLSGTISAYGELPVDEKKDTPLSMAKKLGKKLEADYVLVGTVWRYLDRKGGPAAIETPASVGFALHLIEVRTGILMWTDSFSETQRSLSENILGAKDFFDMGAKWLTADELALYGVKALIMKFPF